MDYHGFSKHISVARNVGLFSLASVAESSSCQSTVRARPVNKKKPVITTHIWQEAEHNYFWIWKLSDII